MKNIAKIAFYTVPPALQMAVVEQLNVLPDRYSVLAAGTTADVWITTSTAKLETLSPILRLDLQRPQRLGEILRQLDQMLRHPVLYVEDVSLQDYVFKPQEKLLQTGAGDEIALTEREVEIIYYLYKEAPRVISRDELLTKVWRYQLDVDTHTLETHIYRLRQKIDPNNIDHLLSTADGGYTLKL